MTDVGTIPLMSDDHQNITQVIKSYSKKLFGFIKSKVANKEDAEDILQEVFYQFAGNTKPIEQVAAWLFTTTRNKITDSYRKKRPELLEEIFTNNEGEEFSWQEILYSSSDNPETEYLRSIFWTTLQTALDELPTEQKDAFIKHELQDMSFEEISRLSGTSVATLISRKRYAVLHLRKALTVLKDELLNY